jgi:hypothetical protein
VHEPFEPQCAFCAKFVRCFDDAGPLAEWGYCADDPRATHVDRKAIADLEAEALSGAYVRLLERASALAVYQETDDGCERFEPTTAPPERRPAAGSG